jgi:hypothetical protein
VAIELQIGGFTESTGNRQPNRQSTKSQSTTDNRQLGNRTSSIANGVRLQCPMAKPTFFWKPT